MQLVFSCANFNRLLFGLMSYGLVLVGLTSVLWATAAPAPAMDKNTLYALSGHVFVGTITKIESKMYIDSSNEAWKEKHILLTVIVSTVLKSSKHTNSLSGDFDFSTKMSFNDYDELVTEGSTVNVLTSSIVSLPQGWSSGEMGHHDNLKVNEAHTFYCTFVGRKRFQFDQTFPYTGVMVNTDGINQALPSVSYDEADRIDGPSNSNSDKGQQQTFSIRHTSIHTYLPLSPNGIGPVVGHEDRIDNAVVTPAETYHFVEEKDFSSFSDTVIENTNYNNNEEESNKLSHLAATTDDQSKSSNNEELLVSNYKDDTEL